MAIDLTGGLSDDREYVFATQPDDPEMRESVNTWVWDNGTEFGMPRIGVEAVADQWETHDIQVNLAFADRACPQHVRDRQGARPARRRRQAAHPRCRSAVVRVDRAVQALARCGSTAWPRRRRPQAQMEGWQAGQSTGEQRAGGDGVEIRSAVPPWESGTLLEEAGYVLAHQEEGALMGGPRFEQLFRTTGTLRVGDDEYTLDGGGLRIRRQGVRRLAAFRGHVWQSTVFPSGRAFGHCVYPPRDRRQGDLQRGVPVRGRRRADPGAGGRRALAGDPRGQGSGRVGHPRDRGRARPRPSAGETALSTFHVMNAARRRRRHGRRFPAAAGGRPVHVGRRVRDRHVGALVGEQPGRLSSRPSGATRPQKRSPVQPTCADDAAVLTGASSGIGVETARGPRPRGRRRRARRARRDRGRSGGPRPRARGDRRSSGSLRLDLRELDSVAAFADAITGPVDLLIANAGVSKTPDAHLAERARRAVRDQPPRPLLARPSAAGADGRARRADRRA